MLTLPNAAGFLFDLDGVLTPTVEIHLHAWTETFDSLLRYLGRDDTFQERDYLQYADGKSRFDGVRSFLQSRALFLPEGQADAAPGFESVQSVGNRKNEVFQQLLERDGIKPYAGSADFVDLVARKGIPWGVVSSSANAIQVLKAAGWAGRAGVVVDGMVAAERGLAGKPDPAMFLLAAALLALPPSEAVVIEDALAGVAAGRAGGFGLVVGVARDLSREELFSAGADRVVSDLSELVGELG